MNIVKILLVLGLGYVALTQKSEKTRNMLLVVTGLLAFCMFSMEGFTIAESAFDVVFGTADTGQGNPANTVIGTEGARTITGSDGAVYTTTGDITSGPTLSGISCLVSSGGASGTPTPVAGNGVGAITEAHNISELFTCEAADDSANSACPGYTATNKPPFCECLKKTEGGHYNCNSGWTGDPGSQGKYIAENAAGSGWEFKDDYSDEKVHKCDADMVSGISGGVVELFSGKCYVKKDETQGCLNLCDPPTSSS